MFKLMLIKNDGSLTYDVTPLVGSFSWDSNLSLMSVMEFELVNTDMPKYFPKNPCDLGDAIILFKDDEEVYRGIIVTEDKNGRDSIKYTVYDYAWYLGNSKSVYQFNNIPVHQAITKILNDFGMLIGNIPTMRTNVDQIFIEKSPAYIISEIVKLEEMKTGVKYNYEMRQGKIYIEPMKDLVIKGIFRLADNLTNHDVLDHPLAAQKTRSIAEMRNRIKIVIELDSDNKEKASYVTTAIEQNAGLISKYGLIEETVKIDAEDASKSREVARILLERLGKIHESNSITLMGDVKFKAGRLFEVKEPITGIDDTFMIKTCKHNVSNQIHTMQLELVYPEEVK